MNLGPDRCLGASVDAGMMALKQVLWHSPGAGREALVLSQNRRTSIFKEAWCDGFPAFGETRNVK